MSLAGTPVWCRRMDVDGMIGVAFANFTLSSPWVECFLFLMGEAPFDMTTLAASLVTRPLAGLDLGAFSTNSLSTVLR